jgi:hypothetical protein
MTAQQNEEAPRPEEVDRLTQETAYWRKKVADARACLEHAEQVLLEEHFRGVSRYSVGDVILVKKAYFDQERLVQAKVIAVNLHLGWRATDRTPVKSVSYSVQLRRKDGQLNAFSDGFWDREVAGLAPQEDLAS